MILASAVAKKSIQAHLDLELHLRQHHCNSHSISKQSFAVSRLRDSGYMFAFVCTQCLL